MTATTYRVAGMSCEGCVQAVTNAIHEQAPGAYVSVDLERATVTVDGADVGMVRGAVEAAGFGYEGPAT